LKSGGTKQDAGENDKGHGNEPIQGRRYLQLEFLAGIPIFASDQQSRSGTDHCFNLTRALEIGDPRSLLFHRRCGELLWPNRSLPIFRRQTAAWPISKQRNAWLQTVLFEAVKLAPRWNPQMAALHAQQIESGHGNRVTLQVARKLVAYLVAVDKSGQPFQMRTPSPTGPTAKGGGKQI
jgi:hypothetical protein